MPLIMFLSNKCYIPLPRFVKKISVQVCVFPGLCCRLHFIRSPLVLHYKPRQLILSYSDSQLHSLFSDLCKPCQNPLYRKTSPSEASWPDGQNNFIPHCVSTQYPSFAHSALKSIGTVMNQKRIGYGWTSFCGVTSIL